MWTSLRRLFLFSRRFSSSHAPSARVSRRQRDDARVSVWLNFNQCKLPDGFHITKVAPAIIAALRANGIKGRIEINAYGECPDEIDSSGIRMPTTGTFGEEIKNYADQDLTWDVLRWVAHYPPPAHLYFICGDSCYANLLHELRMQKYNILLASNDAPVELCSAATIMWDWDTLTDTKRDWKSLVSGEHFVGKHLNYPPDPPDGSSALWYGNFEVPIDDPFSTSSLLDSKLRPVPISLSEQLQNLLKSHPEGMLVDHIRTELAKVDWKFEDNNYSQTKFCMFLLSLPKKFNYEWVDDRTGVKLFSVKPPEAYCDTLLAGGENKAEENISPP